MTETFSISYTKIEKYRRCPFEYKCYVDKNIYRKYHKDTPPLILGQLIHGVLNSFYKELTSSERNLDNLRKLFKTKFLANKNKHYAIFKNQENIIKYVEKAKKQFKFFLDSPYSNIEPYIATESNQTIEIESIEFLAKIDRVDKTKDGFHIIDYKTGKIREETVDPLQLNFYAFVISRKFPESPIIRKTYLYLSENKEIEVEVNSGDDQSVLEITKEIVDQIKKDKDFEPRKNDKCKFCDFIPICPLMKSGN